MVWMGGHPNMSKLTNVNPSLFAEYVENQYMEEKRDMFRKSL